MAIRRLALAWSTAFVLTAVCIPATAATAATAAAAAGCSPVSIPTAKLPSAIVLNGVSALSPTNAWAVGVAGSGHTSRTLVEHWNGHHWAHVTSSGVLTSQSGAIELYAVSARAPSDVWAVGERNQTGVEPDGAHSLILHWNGSAWAIVPAPDPRGGDELVGVVALAANDAWAVGHGTSPIDDSVVTLVEHWDGHSWSVEHGVEIGGDLQGVSASGPDDVWAVGWRFTAGGAIKTLAEHWDGHHWSQVSIPSPGAGAQMNAVSVRSASSGWAAGEGSTVQGHGFVFGERYDGAGWKVVKAAGMSEPHGVADVGSKLAWMVGTSTKGGPAIARWNGTAWRAQPNPAGIHPSATGFLADPFMAIARVSATAAIAVGWQWQDAFDHSHPPIAAHLC